MDSCKDSLGNHLRQDRGVCSQYVPVLCFRGLVEDEVVGKPLESGEFTDCE